MESKGGAQPTPTLGTGDDAPLMVWMSRADGACSYLNEAWFDFTGQTEEEAFGWGWLSVVHPDDVELLEKTFIEANESRATYRLEYRLRRYDGVYRVCVDRGSPRRDPAGRFLGYVGAVVDVTDQRLEEARRKEAEQRLRLSEERVRMAVELADVGTWDFNLVTGELLWSERCKAAFGLPPDAPVNYDVFLELLHPEDRTSTDAQVRAALDPDGPGAYEVDYRCVWPDGSVHWILAKGQSVFQSVGSEKRAVRFMGTVADITRRKVAEQEAREAARRKDEFLAMLAHELRNPLAAIQSAVQVASIQEETTNGVQEPLSVIGRQSQALRTIVDDLLDVSRITRGVVELRRQRLDLAQIVRSAKVSVASVLSERAHRLTIDVPSGLHVWADPVRLEQIVVNLLSNAGKYTPPGGSIELTAWGHHGQVLFCIEDTGFGMEKDDLERVFDLFEQGSRELDREHGGLGIGLTVVKQLVELHGGSIRAHSEGLNRGSTFTVTLPCAAEQSNAAHTMGEVSGADVPPSERPLTTQKVMVVDDNRDAAEMLATLVAMRGHEVRTAHDGREVLDTLERWWPHIVILDIGLPGLDGYKVAKQLRATEAARSPLILVALTGYGQPSDRERAMAAGFDRHVVKPMTLTALQEILRSAHDLRASGTARPNDPFRSSSHRSESHRSPSHDSPPDPLVSD